MNKPANKLSGYKPLLIKAVSWDDIESHYLSLVSHGWHHEQFVGLIRHIKSSDYFARLFACTSLDTLSVSIYDPIEFGRENLSVEFDRDKQGWKFTYRSQPYEKPTFVRKYPADKGIEKFDTFIKMIQW